MMPRPFACVPRFLRHGYALLAVVTGWVFFRSGTLEDACRYLAGMFRLSSVTPEALFYELANTRTLVFLGLGCILSTPLFRCFAGRPRSGCLYEKLLSLCLIGASIIFSMNATYNPFLYFRF